MGWEYKPVMPPAQRLAGLEPIAARMPAQHAVIRAEMERALVDPKDAAVEMPRSADHWADCLIAAKELIATDPQRGIALLRSQMGSLLAMGASVALLHVESALRTKRTAGTGKISWDDLRTRSPDELAAGMFASVDSERNAAARSRLSVARDELETAILTA